MTEKITDYSDLWIPQPGPQRAVYECPYEEICMGGSRGGGKTDAGIGLWLKHLQRNKKYEKFCKGLVLRRTLNELADLTDRAEEVFKDHARFWKATRTFEFGEGGPTIQFAYLERDQDARNYQGKAYTFLWFEEVGQFADDRPLNLVKATLRSTKPIHKVIFYTCNPGGPGHAWIKSRFIDPAPGGMTPIEEEVPLPGGRIVKTERIFIPSHTEDNQVLLQNDPNYQARILESTKGDERLARAWLQGDWDIAAGGMFDAVWDRKKHVLPTIVDVPDFMDVFRSYDWGSARPFSIGWWGRVQDKTPWQLPNGEIRVLARGSLVKLNEWYGAVKDAHNEGLSMIESDIADRVVQMEKEMFPRHRVQRGPADVNLFIADGAGRRLADDWRRRGITWAKPDKERIKGWQRMREMLLNAKEERPEKEGLYFTERCLATIKYLPQAPRDEGFPDDLDPSWPDHVLDEARYAIMHRVSQGITYVKVA